MVSELENRGIEIIYSEEQKRLKNKNSLGDYGTILKYMYLESRGSPVVLIRESEKSNPSYFMKIDF